MTNMNPTYSVMIWQAFDTMSVATSDREWLSRPIKIYDKR